MEVGEYKARRNDRVAAQRLELAKLLEASAFSNPTWDRHLLGHASEEDCEGRVNTRGGPSAVAECAGVAAVKTKLTENVRHTSVQQGYIMRPHQQQKYCED
jgi:hypothetical protein